VLLAVAVAAGCSATDSAPSSSATDSLAVVPAQTFDDYRLIETDNGVRQWVLDSDHMTQFPNRQDLHLTTVKMDFFREGAYYSTLTSDSGLANEATHDVDVWGHVVVTTDDGRRLRTEKLHFDNHTGLITNDIYNIFDRGQDVVTGIGLEATPDLQFLEIKQRVEADVGDDAARDAQ
jgi:LPS export ABC transporter protein LptC